jgi:poly(ADP-ribose) glycohydrolase ARH3
MDKLKSKFTGSLVGAALGDFLGSGGTRYTDDTAMMIGVAESLIENKGFNADHMAQVFAKNFEAEPWRGYGPGPPRIFQMMKSGLSYEAAAENIYPGGSYGNGSAMRIAPIGLFYCDAPQQLKKVTYQSSRITHTHVLGMEGAALQAYAVALAANAQPKALDRNDFLNKLSDFLEADIYKQKLGMIRDLLAKGVDRLTVVNALGNTVEAFNSVPIAIYSFLANAGFAQTLKYALSLGGDRDTICAMTGAIAGACYGIRDPARREPEDIPGEWMGRLENREYIEGLARKLWQIKAAGEK